MANVLTLLWEHQDYQPLRVLWEESQAAFSASGEAIAADSTLQESCEYLRLAPEICAVVRGLADELRQSEDALRFLWHAYYLAFLRTDYPGKAIRTWPDHRDWLGNRGALFNALLFLTGVPLARSRHQDRGIPLEVSVSTLSDFELWVREHYDQTGEWGLREIGWLYHHFRGEIFRLGRLQFLMEPFDIPVVAYRSRDDSAACMLSEGGRAVRPDGRYVRKDSPEDSTAFTTDLREEEYIVGNPINPDGLVESHTVRLPSKEWKLVAKRGDPALSFHIPKDGPLTFEACGESFSRAVTFYPQHFPDWKHRCFFSESWLYDATLARVLPTTSNIVRFQREFYLAPLPNADDSQLFERVFGERPKDLSGLPRDTSLRRSVLDYVDAGGRFHGAGAVIFPEDLAWGQSVYRRGIRSLIPAAIEEHDE